ncbi:MAG TPA: hypothetical protein VKG01_17170, partial [Thermoanaerobaculia bacterium]|nr:hypothetical protein [Thermoanaerobaculia bacterium]
MKRLSAAPLAAAAIGVVALLFLDGDLPLRPRPAGAPPAALGNAVRAAADDLSRRTEVLATRPEVVRSLAGGGIAVNRIVLFSAARQAMEDAAPGTWIALTDVDGTVHAWWGDAPASLAGLVSADGIEARWSAMDLTLLYRRSVGQGRGASIIYGARTFPVEAPDFAAALGLTGNSLAWEPSKPAANGGVGDRVLLRGASGQPLVQARPSGVAGHSMVPRGIALGVALAMALLLLGRGLNPARTGAALALLFLAAEAAAGPGALSSWRIVLLAVGPLLVPFVRERPDEAGPLTGRPAISATLMGYWGAIAAIFASAAVSPPELGGPPRLINLTRPAALTGLLAAALFSTAVGRRSRGGRQWTTAALAATALPFLLGLALVSPSFLARALVFLFFAAAFDLWTRASRGILQPNRISMTRIFIGATLLALLLIAPVSEQRRAERLLHVAHGIVLPDPAHASANAVFAAERAAARVGRIDLDRDLPAGPEDCDLSDLAYRIWKDGERQPGAPVLAAYEVYDSAGLARSGFSIIPEWGQTRPEAPAVIDRHRVALVRRSVTLAEGGNRWGRVIITVADWPVWDPLPPRIEVYRRLVLGERESLLATSAPRPVLAGYGRDAEPRDEGPALPAPLKERLRRAGGPVPVHLPYRGEEIWGEVRPTSDGYELVAIPGPAALGRFLTAALLIPGAALLYGVVGLVLVWKLAAAPQVS